MGTSNVVQFEGLAMNEETNLLEPGFVWLARAYPEGSIRESSGQPGIGDSKIGTKAFLEEFDRAMQKAVQSGINAGIRAALEVLAASKNSTELYSKLNKLLEESRNA